MKELSKSIPRRMRDPNFLRRYFLGHGVDIGGKPDPLSLYGEFFPLMEEVTVWDLEDGDAQLMADVADGKFDFVHSSHCLEHLRDPAEALKNWLRVVKPGGFVIVLIPDEDLYEQRVFPSTFNLDHKHTYTIHKDRSWSESSINVMDLLAALGPEARVEKVELLAASYRFELPRYDQTYTPVGECAIEFVIRKATPAEQAAGGLIRPTRQPSRDLRIHLNQYRDDARQMKRSNVDRPPFTNDSPL